ncbi:GNAT family N-acetyltransferase [Roseibaca sp. Y0-43]|nr:GNAT family N-acetyltransferase [Roseibaca sp. Y0-43]
MSGPQDPLFPALAALCVTPEQEEFSGSFAYTLQDWAEANSDDALLLAFLLDSTPVGLALVKRGQAAPDWVPARAASLHGLKIATRYQGRGLGRLAMAGLMTALGTHWPETDKLVLAVDAANDAALALYRDCGMRQMGPPHAGRLGPEYRIGLTLR